MGYILLALFAITLFVLYIAVRRAWGQPLYLGSIGVILCAVFVMLFALIHEKTSTAQALLAGFVVGIAFPVVVVIIAVFFRTNQPAANVRIVSEPRSPQARASQPPPAGDEDTGPDA